MDTFEAIKARRAVKHFDPDHEMTASEIQKLMESTLQSPTSFNIQHWRFLLVEDKDQRQKIRDVAWDQAQVTEASLLIVVCADTEAWGKNTNRYWRNAPKEVQDFLVPAIGEYYRDKPQTQRDEAMRSTGIAAQSLMLSAKAMGYDSCPMVGFDFDKVGELINLPKDHVISMLISVGKKTTDARPKGGQLAYNEVVFKNSF